MSGTLKAAKEPCVPNLDFPADTSVDTVFLHIIQTEYEASFTKVEIKYFCRFLLVAHGQKPPNPHFQRPITLRINEEDRRNLKRCF